MEELFNDPNRLWTAKSDSGNLVCFHNSCLIYVLNNHKLPTKFNGNEIFVDINTIRPVLDCDTFEDIFKCEYKINSELKELLLDFASKNPEYNIIVNPTCSICYELVIDEQVKFSPDCKPGHVFHQDCIMNAINKGHINCPNCRIINTEAKIAQEKAIADVEYAKRTVNHYRADFDNKFWLKAIMDLYNAVRKPRIPLYLLDEINEFLRKKIREARERDDNEHTKENNRVVRNMSEANQEKLKELLRTTS
jgi:hypothetical protein